MCCSADDGPGPFQIGYGRDFKALTGSVPSEGDLTWTRRLDGGYATALEVVSPAAVARRIQLLVDGAPRRAAAAGTGGGTLRPG